MPGVAGGCVFEKKTRGYTYQITPDHYVGLPDFIVEDNSYWFEPIEEKSDEEVVREWMIKLYSYDPVVLSKEHFYVKKLIELCPEIAQRIRDKEGN